MKRAHVVFVVGAMIAIAIPVGLLVYKSSRTASLHEALIEDGFTRAACSPEVSAGAAEVTCYAGAIGPTRATLSFVTRLVPASTPRASSVASSTTVVVVITHPDGTTRTERFDEVWTAETARKRLKAMEKKLAN